MKTSHLGRFAAGLVLASFCVAAFADAGAVRITDSGQLIPGLRAQGKIGDYLLYNGYVRVIIDDYTNPHGFAMTGGNIIDAASATGQDNFASMFTMFDDHFGRQAGYTSITIVNAGGGSNTAQIRCTDADSENPSLAAVTDYYLGPNDQYVTVVTTLTNNGSTPISMLEVGDAFQWGATGHFAPGWLNTNRNILGDGYDIGGKTMTVPWICADGYGAAYGVTTLSGSFSISDGAEWTDTIVGYLNLAASGGSGAYTRYLFIGTDSIASVSNLMFVFRGTTIGTLSGTVTETGTGAPISGATVVINTVACLGATGSKSYTIAHTDASGHYTANLEPGSYQVLFEATGRTNSSCQAVSITANNTTTLNQTLSLQGTLSWTVTESGLPVPAKISVLYYPHTTKWEGPALGDNISLTGGYAILSASGSGSAQVPPNDTNHPQYEVWVSRGPEYSVYTQVVTVSGGSTTSITAPISRVVDSTGYVCGDQHLHSANSPDSSITLDNRAREAACEGLEIIVNTDHDYITDMTPNIASTGMGSYVNAFSGEEITTDTWGHFQGYPLTLHPEQQKNGALVWQGLTPTQIFAWERSDPKDPVVQVNHPRAGGLGYFDLMSLNPITGTSPNPNWNEDFDAVEVYNGKRLYQIPLVLNDWYRLLNRGKIATGLGNTDSHLIFSQEIGSPRNYVLIGTDIPANCTEDAFRDAVKAGHCFLTNGPFVELTVDSQALGHLVSDTDGSVDVHVKVQAPSWMTVDTLNIIANGQVAQSVTIPTTSNVIRLDQTYTLAISKDSWIAAEVKGGSCDTDSSSNCITAGCPGRMDPIVPPMYGTDPVCPYAHTNPVFVDFDNNGHFDPPGNMGLVVEPISATRTVDGNYLYTRLNEVVTVRGTVTVGSYTFNHSSNNPYFQDNSQDLVNHLSGGTTIYQSNLVNPALVPGDQIQVTGTITNYDGLLEMSGVAINKIGAGPVPDPAVVTISQINSATGGEQYEGMLVRVNNVTNMTGTWPAFGANANMTITDATGSMTMRILSDTDMDGATAPVPPFDVIGAVSQYDTTSPFSSGFELMPRQMSDIVQSSSALAILHAPAADAVTSCSATIKWYTNKTGSSSVDFGITSGYGSTATGTSGVSAHSAALSGLSPSTAYHFRVTTDTVSSGDCTFTTAATVSPAIVSGPTVSFITGTSVQILWSTDIPSTSQVNYGTIIAYGSSASGPSGVTQHYATLSSLAPGTTYHYQVASTSAGCGGGSLGSADAIFDTPMASSAPPEVSTGGSQIPFKLSTFGSGIQFRFEYRGAGFRYHLYGAASQAAMDSGAYSVKACDLKNNAQGSWATDGSSWITWTLTDGSLLPACNYLIVAETGGVEGSYGRKSDGSYRGHDGDQNAPTTIGCGTVVCASVSANFTGVAPSATVTQGTQQTFSGSGTGEGTLTYQWDFHYNGSTFNPEATGAIVNYTYAAQGSYTAALRITDSCPGGAQTAIATTGITINPSSCGPIVVISQVYGGGGNSGSYWKNDYIELHNRGDQAQDLTGWSVQYASAAGSSWTNITNLSGSIASGGYFLIQEAAGGGGTTSLPTPDVTANINMSGTAGKVALVNSTTALSGSCPTGAQIKDFVGYGTTANCYEGTGPAPAPSNATMDKRNNDGCTDTNHNASDFTAVAANASNPPRNTASPSYPCSCP